MNERALLRIIDPTEPQGEPPQLEKLPDDFFYAVRREQVEKIEYGFDFAVGDPEFTNIYLSSSSESDEHGTEANGETTNKQESVPPRHVNVANLESKYKGIDEEPWES